MSIMKKLVIALLFVPFTRLQAQEQKPTSPVTFSGYLETYYTYDVNKPSDGNRPAFIYSHNRHNEVNINLGFVKAAYQQNNVRANIALAVGTYMNANYAAEPGVLKNIYEANAGVKISNTKNIWVDAGILPSHIGFESAIGKDCWTLTRGILADNSPYFETGARISYTSADGKWYLSGLLLNGWQRIQRVEGNSTPAFGHQLTFKPNDKITLNSSSFIGNDKPDSIRQMRYFHNFYGIFQVTQKLGLIAGFDIGAEQKQKGSGSMNTWYTPNLIVRLQASPKTYLAARAEYYCDKNGVIIATGTPGGFQTWGYSLNFDYLIRDNVMWRIEARGLNSRDKIFLKENQTVKDNIFITTALAVSL